MQFPCKLIISTDAYHDLFNKAHSNTIRKCLSLDDALQLELVRFLEADGFRNILTPISAIQYPKDYNEMCYHLSFLSDGHDNTIPEPVLLDDVDTLIKKLESTEHDDYYTLIGLLESYKNKFVASVSFCA